MEDFIMFVTIMTIFGYVLGIGVISLTEVDKPSILIEQCEKSSPRDQHCTLIAVPESVK